MLSHKGFEQGLTMKKRRIEVKHGADVREIILQIALRAKPALLLVLIAFTWSNRKRKRFVENGLIISKF